MEIYNTSLFDHRRQLVRNDSLSTVSSSVAAADVRRQQAELSARNLALRDNFYDNGLNNQTAIRFENNENIHVGTIIHQHYHVPPIIIDELKQQNTSTRHDSFSSLFERPPSSVSDDFNKVKRFFRGRNRKRKIFILVSVISILVLLSVITPTIYFTVNKNYQHSTTEGSTDGDSTTTTLNERNTERSTDDSTTTTESTTTTTTTTDSTTTTTIDSTTTSTIDSTTTTIFDYIPRINFPDLLIRNEWSAEQPKNASRISSLELPINRIIIAHTGGTHCNSEEVCKALVKSIQKENFESGLNDIAYNFLLGDDGKIYEGTGFDTQGEHSSDTYGSEYNSIGICIAFIGNYQTTNASSNQIDILKQFIDYYKEQEIILDSFQMISRDEIVDTQYPATALISQIKQNYSHQFYYIQDLHRRNAWSAVIPREIQKFNRQIDWMMVTHTKGALCTNLSTCKTRMQSLQQNSFINSKDDIEFNFFIGGAGFIFEGRGWDNEPQHISEFDKCTIQVALIGTFTTQVPNVEVMNAIVNLFNQGKTLRKLSENFTINASSDYGYDGLGQNTMSQIRDWTRYQNRSETC